MSNVTTPTSKEVSWMVGTVTQIRPEAPGLRSYCFEFEQPVSHDAGQHYEIRLTAEDGYQAARLYSAAMPANGSGRTLQLTIALMPYGEVSPYIFNHVKTGDRLEIRGPLGRYFVWTSEIDDPVLLVGGGTGVVPLRAIRTAHQQSGSKTSIRLVYSVKTYFDMAYKYELFPRQGQPSRDVIMTFTRQAPTDWAGFRGRIDRHMIWQILGMYKSQPATFVCGPTPMVESVSNLLVEAGVDPNKIKTERFGATS